MSDLRSGLVSFHADLEGLLKPIDLYRQHPENYNNGDVDALSESIEVNGMYRPIYVQASTGYIIAGNHTWQACKSLGSAVIPVVELDVDDNTARRIMLADNRIASLALPDPALTVNLLDTLMANEGTLLGTGYQPHDLEVLKHLAEIPLETDEFAQWPTISVQVPPNVRRAYMTMTEGAGGDRERFELILRLAGWDGK